MSAVILAALLISQSLDATPIVTGRRMPGERFVHTFVTPTTSAPFDVLVADTLESRAFSYFARPSAEAAWSGASVASLDESIINAQRQCVGAGVVSLVFADPVSGGSKTVPVTVSATTNVVSVRYSPDSFAGICNASVSNRIAGTTLAESGALFASVDHTSRSFSYSTNCWAADVDWSSLSSSNSRENGFRRAGVAITHRHVLTTDHYRFLTGDTLWFTGADNVTVSRSIIGSAKVDGLDARVYTLDSDLPLNIVPVSVLGADTNITHLYNQLNGCVINQHRSVSAAIINTITSDRLFYRQPIVEPFASFYQPLVDGDSSSPLFLLHDDRPLLVAVAETTSSAASLVGREELLDSTISLSDADAGVSTGYEVTVFGHESIVNNGYFIGSADGWTLTGASYGNDNLLIDSASAIVSASQAIPSSKLINGATYRVTINTTRTSETALIYASSAGFGEISQAFPGSNNIGDYTGFVDVVCTNNTKPLRIVMPTIGGWNGTLNWVTVKRIN